MKIGIGIDTGGTYTDAVAYDFETKRVLASAKSLTTRDDLSKGIGGALDGIPVELLEQAKMASLSTTLATNACVEGKGGRAKLLFIGVGRETLQRVGARYGITDGTELFFCDAQGTFDGKQIAEPDWDTLLEDAKVWMSDADGLGVVELFAMKNGAACEKKAKELFSGRFGVPVVCGSELFSGLNSVQRGSGTLLNAKLVPIIGEFLEAIRKAFRARGLTAPVVIVRSDGSLMSESFARLRPVETILCGPAASVLGGRALAGAGDAVIVDMGGTTTDVSLIRGGIPVRASEGINIGKWRTFVRGVFIDTFGLGGDTAVRVKDGGLLLETRRVQPISLLSRDVPGVKDLLRAILASKTPHTQPIHELFCLVRQPGARAELTTQEKLLVEALKNGPLGIREAAEAAGTDIYHLDSARLESEGYILRAGMTPTDVMHIRGEFSAYDTEAAELTARFLMRCLGMDEHGSLEPFCELVYDAVKRRLYRNIVRILLENAFPDMLREQPSHRVIRLIEESWDSWKAGGRPFFDYKFMTSAALVGIGAPTYIFLPDVAKALGAKCIIPENAGVANAVGAIVGNIAATATVEIHPNHTPGGIQGYTVHCASGNFVEKQRPDAEKLAAREAEREAREEAARRGVTGDVRVSVEMREARGTTGRNMTVDLGSTVEATAIGGALL